MAIIVLCVVFIICIVEFKKKQLKKDSRICIHTKLDCENCMSQKSCKQKDSLYLVKRGEQNE